MMGGWCMDTWEDGTMENVLYRKVVDSGKTMGDGETAAEVVKAKSESVMFDAIPYGAVYAHETATQQHRLRVQGGCMIRGTFHGREAHDVRTPCYKIIALP